MMHTSPAPHRLGMLSRLKVWLGGPRPHPVPPAPQSALLPAVKPLEIGGQLVLPVFTMEDLRDLRLVDVPARAAGRKNARRGPDVRQRAGRGTVAAFVEGMRPGETRVWRCADLAEARARRKSVSNRAIELYGPGEVECTYAVFAGGANVYITRKEEA